MIIDTHCHLYLEEFDNDRDIVMQRAKDLGVQQFYLPAIDSSVTNAMFKMEHEYADNCFLMMGLHPCSVQENFEKELSLAYMWLQKRKFIAIGEIGLDFYWDTTFKEQQIIAFEQQMEWALEFDLPIVIHTREAMQQTIDCVKPFAQKGVRGVFHCFSGSKEQANQITDMQFLLGIGGVVTYKNAGLAETLKQIDMKHIVVETDAPYLTPVPHRGKRNESAYLTFIINKIAEVKEISAAEVAAITTNNATTLFQQERYK
ncbi:MAG: TatD family hydrolase [Chitinophagaceae bacterium]|nr:TatD family hydrolase [Chitinophagaceae bacterium]MCW5904522.1 TatD family hydrolase [Chitinophagaceae bacterium]